MQPWRELLSQSEVIPELSKVSALSNYRLVGFSVERLMNYLTALDQDVEIVIRRKPKSQIGGRITVTT
jgi:predicted XRE-type DNA-binding protein